MEQQAAWCLWWSGPSPSNRGAVGKQGRKKSSRSRDALSVQQSGWVICMILNQTGNVGRIRSFPALVITLTCLLCRHLQAEPPVHRPPVLNEQEKKELL